MTVLLQMNRQQSLSYGVLFLLFGSGKKVWIVLLSIHIIITKLEDIVKIDFSCGTNSISLSPSLYLLYLQVGVAVSQDMQKFLH